MSARVINAISAIEFTHMIQSVKPPSGWSESLAIANSGGPDSTCLIFLLNRYLRGQKDGKSQDGAPTRLVSLSIDHDLQSVSAEMAEHAAGIADSLGVEHITTKLPWGQENHPPRPGPHNKIEEVARAMRYVAFFKNMHTLNANTLAMGHHIDDQVETMLMRLGRGTNRYGLAGMRPCRRWGMGSESEPYGIEGMRRWIIRPLLSVGKDRILATCDENKLEYVHDPTNFQPQLTIRNAIRHVIKQGGSTGLTSNEFTDFPHSIAEQLAAINVAASNDPACDFSLASSLDHLRSVNQNMCSERLDIDNEVDEIISKSRLPSPPGTFMIPPSSLMGIDSQAVREALLFRIARTVSPEPWGHPRAELGRRKTSVKRLSERLWDFRSFKTRNNNSICVGSGVWWRLVASRSKRMRTTVKDMNFNELAWLALRQPGFRASNAEKSLNPLHLEVTGQIIKTWTNGLANQASNTSTEVLYDLRFLIHFEIHKMPLNIQKSLSSGGKIYVQPRGVWNLPQIIHKEDGVDTVIHTNIVHQPFFWTREWGTKNYRDVLSDWISVQYFRPHSAV